MKVLGYGEVAGTTAFTPGTGLILDAAVPSGAASKLALEHYCLVGAEWTRCVRANTGDRHVHGVGVVLAAGSPIHVRKLRPDGSQAFAWDGVVLRCDAAGIVLRAPFNVDLVDLGFTTFRRGDEFVEFYYWERPYNVFQVSSPDGTLKGWYANVGLPAELESTQGELRYVDLALDVWTHPNGEFLVLDQDEYDVLIGEHAELADTAERGRTALLALVRSGALPRWAD